MGHTDPELRDAYRETAQAIAAEQRRDSWMTHRAAELRAAMLRPLTARIQPMYAFSASRDELPVGDDFAAWVAMQGDRDVALSIWSAADRQRLIDQYVEARARADAAVRDCETDWRAEALEAAEWTRGGQP